ncbi:MULTISPECIES: ABC transporter substrate-binding protein [Ramlibacter]|uniref:ABC transporter substrate-binding protein n=1 Tax=Ramlibacter pinisoli TaxID=2682844 RepID=A0A6N8ILX8_9BURK|nr:MULTISPECIES: ABC transporter substrate-binding protein [Ramlibacter]MBA2960492.1 ABC transporter substrate-binding protein [Ramlibacter sp. CGMCC 1.13660]MVQ27824.1 ABC transporter substrate-binding protein [Ramlibacter pinisoli]
MKRRLALSLVFAAALVGAARGEPGVTPHKVVIGMSAPLSGPLAVYGNELEKGLRLGLAQANGAAGVGGRQLELLVKDDGGNPERAVANTRALLDGGVLALTGFHGPASIEAVLPLIEQARVPLVGAASSAELLREPLRRHVFNLRAAAREEAAAMVLQLDTVGMTEIAAITQDDALGRAAAEGVQVELSRLAIRPLAFARLSAAAGAAQAVQVACKTPPQALILGLDAGNALAVIRAARKAGCTPQFYVMSEAGTQLVAGGASPGELAGVIVSQVLPHPRTASVPVAADYLRLAAGAPSYAGLEGFVYARVITEALRRCGREPTRACLVDALESRPVDTGGYRVQFTPQDRRGSRFVEMTIVTPDGRFRR